MTATDLPFDLLEPLPQGRFAIQASAGTGKTFTLAALATRFVAEQDVLASELLIVTFTRAATAELRSRVRERLVEVASHLAADPAPATADPLLTHLAGPDRALHLARVERAVTEFDTATITTIHGFATQVLTTLGATSGTDLDAVLVEEGPDEVVQVCADVLARASAAGHEAGDLPGFKALVQATHSATGVADLVLEPTPGRPGATPKELLLAQLVGDAVHDLRARRQQAGSLSFDDILTELRRALDGPGSSAAIESLRNRYRVALIDEFQDTDPVQWDIFRTLFGDDSTGGGAAGSLVLVGDPKQAIYAFRGANVHTYLEALGDAGDVERLSLDTSWRSDGAFVGALDTLFEGATFGDGPIAFTSVQAAPDNQGKRLLGPGDQPLPPLRLRFALGDDIGRNRDGTCTVKPLETAVYRDLAHQVRDLLDGATLPGDGPGDPGRPVRPSDVAVLVKANAEATAIQGALLEQGIPAVLARGGSVLDSPAAEHWRWLLHALGRPSDVRRARTYALSWFAGWTAEQVDAATDAELSRLQEQLHEWVELLARAGVASFIRNVSAQSDVAARVLSRPDGDRHLTDLGHVGELMMAAAEGGTASVGGLLASLDKPPVVDPDAEKDGEVAARRIESDAEAVQIMTIWVSKGLEFPIVCAPTLWRQPRSLTYRYQDPETGERALDLAGGSSWPDKEGAAARSQLARREDGGEHLRLLYVALTRARHQTLVWWGRAQGSEKSCLARMLFARDEQGQIDPDAYLGARVALPEDDDALDAVGPLLSRSGGAITAERHGTPARRPDIWVDPELAPARPTLEQAKLLEVPDRSRHRWSFSSISDQAESTHFDPAEDAAAERDGDPELVTDEPDVDEEEDDATADVPAPVAGEAGPPLSPLAPSSPFHHVPAGASLGTLVHAVLEEIDFTSPELATDLRDELGHQLTWRPVDLTPVTSPPDGSELPDGRTLLVDAVQLAIETPLGPLLGGVRLRDLGPHDRLDELSFELLLAADGPRCGDRDLGRAVARHLDPEHPLQPWAHDLADGIFDVDLAGHLTGSIDAVLRVHDEQGQPRFVVVDYKTNRLTERGQAVRVGDYAPAALAEAMAAHHYPLQALLYAVALHRYLRWRLPDYDAGRHLGGAAYLFLRGMTGADVVTTDGHPDGVFSWPIPPALVTDLSDLLAGIARPSGAAA